MEKPQKFKISIKLELPVPFEEEDTQCVHISVVPIPRNIGSLPPLSSQAPSYVKPSGESVCPFLAGGSGGRSCTGYTHYHQGPIPEDRGRASYHDRCTTSSCDYYGRCPKSKSRSRSESSESTYKGCPSPDPGPSENNATGIETSSDK